MATVLPIVGGKQQTIDALGDEVVEEGNLIIDIGLGWDIGLDVDVTQFVRRLFHALGGGGEIADTDQFRHVDERNLLAGECRCGGNLAAVIFLRRKARRSAGLTSKRVYCQIVRPVPAGLRMAVPARIVIPAAASNNCLNMVSSYIHYFYSAATRKVTWSHFPGLSLISHMI